MRPALPAAILAAVLAVPLVALPATADQGRPVARGAAVTLKALPAKAQAGDRLTLSGKAPARSSVVVQRKYAAGGWAKVATTTASGSGAWSSKVKLVQGGTTSFRAKVGAKASTADRLKVYQWLSVTQQKPRILGGPDKPREDVTVKLEDGKKYPHSVLLTGDSTAAVVVKTASLCTKASVVSGFTQASEPSEDATVELMAGDIEKSEPQVEKVTKAGHVSRVGFSLAGTDLAAFVSGMGAGTLGSGDTGPTIASPKVLCNASRLPKVKQSDLPGRAAHRTFFAR